MKENKQSAIWGGATVGLIVGLILGFFISPYWYTVGRAVIVGILIGIGANILAFIGNLFQKNN